MHSTFAVLVVPALVALAVGCAPDSESADVEASDAGPAPADAACLQAVRDAGRKGADAATQSARDAQAGPTFVPIPRNATVNGNTLGDNEYKHVAWLAENVDGAIDRDVVAAVTWWSLKEGVLSLDNAHAHNLCTRGGVDGPIGPLEICANAWQVGIAAAQVPNWSLAGVRAFVRTAHGDGADEAALLRTAAELAGGPVDAVVASTGALRGAWLLRDGQTGVLATYEALGPCVDSWVSWCGGSWDSAVRYGNTQAAMHGAVADLVAIFAATRTGAP